LKAVSERKPITAGMRQVQDGLARKWSHSPRRGKFRPLFAQQNFGRRGAARRPTGTPPCECFYIGKKPNSNHGHARAKAV